MKASPFCRIVGASLLGLAALAAAAQGRPPTTEQLGKDPGALRQEAERQQAQERAQQQQSSQRQADQQYNDALRQNQSRAAGDAAQGEAVRRTWQQRPPLAPEKNPLLGRWESLGVGQRKGGAAGLTPEMANLANALLGGITGGLCDSMLGRGTIEFRPAGLVAIGSDGRERPMYRAEYRGGGSRVVVLPQGGTSFTHMIIDFDGADRATVNTVGCGLARAGGGGSTARAAMANTSVAAADPGPSQQQWTLLGTSAANGGMDVYVAPASVRRSGDHARMLGLFDFKTRQDIEGKAFHSARNEYEYDCARPRQRMLTMTGFAGRMGKGAVVDSSNAPLPWEPVGSSGPAYEHWQVACKRR
jgi:hypothetical protein